jgi:hypothetical protein
VSPQRARRQHTAARAYLLGFADHRGQLCMHSRDGNVARPNATSASVVRDFYTYAAPDGQPDESVERWFAERVEAPAAAVLRAIRAGEDVRAEWAGTLAAFVASSMLRTSTVRSYMEQIDAQIGPLLALHYAAERHGVDLLSVGDPQRQALLEAARAALASVPADPRERRRSQLRTMLRKTDEWSALIAGWNWELLRSPEPVLITGDAPVVVLDDRPGDGWRGILPAGSTVAVPVAPTALLVASPHPLLGDGALTSTLAAQVSSGVVRGCHRAVFHHPETPWPSGLAVPSRPPSLPAPTVRWGEPDGGPPTFPAAYPEVVDAATAEALEGLGATDTAE